MSEGCAAPGDVGAEFSCEVSGDADGGAEVAAGDGICCATPMDGPAAIAATSIPIAIIEVRFVARIITFSFRQFIH